MNKLKSVCVALGLATTAASYAGGLLTNTNQNIAFLRNPARDAAIGIDGVYSNPAGVAFLGSGLHLSINIQNVHQTRTVTSTFAPFAYGEGNFGAQTKEFKGKANAPILPSLQAAWNKNGWSLQFNFAVTGGGGKCVFDNGLGSFESIVSLLPMLSQNLDAVTTQMGLGQLGLPTVDQYKMNTYMRGRQYYYGFTLGAARKLNDNWSVYLGARLLYGTSNYYGYVSNIQGNIGGQWVNAPSYFSTQSTAAAEAVGKFTALAQEALAAGNAVQALKYQAQAKEYSIKGAMLGALGSATQDVTLNCDQTGWGIAPIIGVDYKTGDFNFAAKYEFRTKMNLKNQAANSESAKNLALLDRYEDGKHVREDSPALFTVGAQWEVLPQLRVSAGWHHYFDKDAKQFKGHQNKLDGNTNEYLFGAEYDVNDMVQVSAGVQKTSYKFTPEYMEDLSFNVSSHSVGLGVGVKLSENMKLNVAYFQTFYKDFSRQTNDYNNNSKVVGNIVQGVATQLGVDETTANAAAQGVMNTLTTAGTNGKSALYGADTFTRSNRVIGVGLDITI